MKEKRQKRTDQGQVTGKDISADLWGTGKPLSKTMFGLSVLGFQNDHTLGQEKPNFYNFTQLKNSENLRISQVVF